VVVSGELETVARWVSWCQDRGVHARLIDVDYASHCELVEPVRERLLEQMASIVPGPARIPMYSTVTGAQVDNALDADYWYRNLRETVRLRPVIEDLAGRGHRVFAEIGPHPVLTGALQDTLEGHPGCVVTGTLRRDEGLSRFLINTAELFAAGVEVDWKPYFENSGARRVPLPTYAFQRDHYWLRSSTPTGASTPELGDVDEIVSVLGEPAERERSSLTAALPLLAAWRERRAETALLDSWRYRVEWKPLPATALDGTLTGVWVVVVPHDGADLPITEALTVSGARVVRVAADPLSDNRTELASRIRDALLDQSVHGVLSLLGLGDGPEPLLREGVAAGTAGALLVVQALADAGIDAPLWCVTRDAVVVDGRDEAGGWLQAGVWGLATTVALEQPFGWGGVIDLPADPDQWCARRLAGVLAAGRGGEDQVAIRPSGVFARRLHRITTTAEPVARREWPTEGTVLVTGGTGGLGAVTARWLAARGVEHLLLVSRGGFESAGAAELVAELEAAGSRVTVAACDVSDRAALAAILDGIAADCPLVAVVHAAGVLDDGVVDSLDTQRLLTSAGPKVTGLVNLHVLTLDMPLEAFVVFSSIAGVLGSPGQGNYAAANAVLDAFIQYRRALGLPGVSIAWGHWARTGMADGPMGQHLTERGTPPMPGHLAVGYLAEALTQPHPNPVVAALDWSRFLGTFTADRPNPLFSDIAEAGVAVAGTPDDVGTTLRHRLAGMEESERERALLDLISTHTARVLGRSNGVFECRFGDVGMDSLMGVELRNRLRGATGLALPATLIFDYPDPVALAGYLGSRLGGAAGAADDLTEEEAAVRAALARIPLARLRSHGLLTMLLELAQDTDPGGTRADASIGEMEVDDLLALAMDLGSVDGTAEVQD
jgi:NAD(P)-dependent dehydrogenase (short-subunit alcohol dehydrogenase family)